MAAPSGVSLTAKSPVRLGAATVTEFPATSRLVRVKRVDGLVLSMETGPKS